MARDETGLRRALARIPELRDEFWQNVSVPGPKSNLNKNLEYAGRVADYLEFAELLTLKSKTPDGEALRDDEQFSYVAAWEFQGLAKQLPLHKEPLTFEFVTPPSGATTRCASTSRSGASRLRTPPGARTRSRSTPTAAKASCGTCAFLVNGRPARSRPRRDRLPAAHALVPRPL
jgi:hypothetical protein